MVNWLREHHEWVWWLLAISAVVFVGSLVALRAALIRIPPDFFNREPGAPSLLRTRRPVLWISLRLAKNLLGAVLLIAGAVMLLTPGQGILSIVLGVSLLDFPGKRHLQRKLLGNRQVLRAINKLRARAGRPPLEAPHPLSRYSGRGLG
ncbi:MAG: hypothetical protein HY000_21150 [Planctomycetes bacterium]|nr:hypothetical protein [Planctomycetota bacterium]